jgi:hypothetical protein
MTFQTARQAAADHFRRRWATLDPQYADPANSEYYIQDNDINIYFVDAAPEDTISASDSKPGKWTMYGSFDGTIYCTVKTKKDGTFWCPATSIIR